MLLRADWQTRRTLSFLIFVIDMTKLLDFFTIKLSRSWLVKQVVHVARWLTESSRVLAVAGVVVCLFVCFLVIIIFYGNWITAKSEILNNDYVFLSRHFHPEMQTSLKRLSTLFSISSSLTITARHLFQRTVTHSIYNLRRNITHPKPSRKFLIPGRYGE